MRFVASAASILAMVCSCSGGGGGGGPDATENPDATESPDAAVTPDAAENPGACPTAENVLQGSVTIQNVLDVAALAGYTRITGDLMIQTQGVAAITLPDLCAIDGQLATTGTTGLDTLAAPNLISVGHDVLIRGVASLDLSHLWSVGGTLMLQQVRLTDLDGLGSLHQVHALFLDSRTITDADGLAHLTDIPGNLLIAGLPLAGAGGLSHIVHVGGVVSLGVGWSDLTPLAGLLHIDGGLQIVASAAMSTSSSALVTIGGLSLETGTGPVDLTLSSLTSVGAVMFGTEQVSRIDLPLVSTMVTRVADTPIVIAHQPSLTTIHLPALVTSPGFSIADAPALATIDLRSLASAPSGFSVSDAAVLTSVDLRSLQTASRIGLTNAGALTSVDTTALETLGTATTYTGLTVVNCDALTSLSFPALASLDGGFDIEDNAGFSHLMAPVLHQMTQHLWAIGNPMWKQCEIDAIIAGLVTPLPPGSAIMSGNGTGTCP